MGLFFSKCCRRNSVSPDNHIKLLLLGLKGSGKTEIAHLLAKRKRTDFEPTNGSQYYRLQLSNEHGKTQSVGVTEIGGNEDMQRIWHHYFAGTMAIIYCYEMSSTYEHFYETFRILEKLLSHPFIRGKSILLIGTKSDLVDEGLQLYDIDNTFQLEAMAEKYSCSLKMCYSGFYSGENNCSQSLNDGIHWLVKSVLNSYYELQMRIKKETNMKAWQEQTQKLAADGKMKRWSYRRFPFTPSKRRKRQTIWKYVRKSSETYYIRPHTAPNRVYTITQGSWQASVETIETTISVPNDLNDKRDDINDIETKSEQVTRV